MCSSASRLKSCDVAIWRTDWMGTHVSLASSKIMSGAHGRGLHTPSSSLADTPHARAATFSVTHAPSHATRPLAHPHVAPFWSSAPAGHTGHPPCAALGQDGRDAHAAAHAHSAATSANAVLARSLLLFMDGVLLPRPCVHSSRTRAISARGSSFACALAIRC
jgi:hypothetical protein